MDFQALMKQAQLVQLKFQEAQKKMQESTAEGVSGAGLVKVVLRGTHELASINIDESLMVAGESEVLSDLIKAAHADAHKKLEALNADLMKDATGGLGPNGGLPNMPRFF
jgi:hypothetical protein